MDRSVVLAALVALLIYPVILVIQAWMRRRKFIELVERLPGPKAKPLVGNTMDFRVPREGKGYKYTGIDDRILV